MLSSFVVLLAVAAPLPKANPDHVLLLKDKTWSRSDSKAFLAKEEALMKSDAVLNAVAEDKAVQQLAPTGKKKNTKWIRDGLRFDQKPEGRLRVWFSSRSPRVQKAVLDAVYRAYCYQAAKKSGDRGLTTLDARRQTVLQRKQQNAQRMIDVETKIATIVQANPAQGKQIYDQIRASMQAQVEAIEKEMAAFEEQEKQALRSFQLSHRLERIPE